MTESMVASATGSSELRAVDAVLHDASFSLSELYYDRSTGVVEIPIGPAKQIHDLTLRRDASHGGESSTTYVLKVLNVGHLETHDPDALVEHSYAHLSYTAPGRLVLSSNFPGGAEFDVSDLDVRVYATGSAA